MIGPWKQYSGITEMIPAHLDMVSQGTKTVQEVLNNLKKYATQMIHPPDIYTFCKRFVLALCDSLCNEVLKKATMPNSALLISYMKLLV